MAYSRILPWIALSALLGLWNMASAPPAADLAARVVPVVTESEATGPTARTVVDVFVYDDETQSKETQEEPTP